MSIAVGSQAACERAIALTLDYVHGRTAFGTPVAAFQNTKFVLAGLSAKVAAGRALVDAALADLDRGELSGADAARVKLYATELQAEVVDACLQLHGGYGYMLEYPIARMYADARVSRIYGGSSEIMKVLIAKDLGL
jgi:alkylation response protein AidB-like acyl-CoA dehydrogenase